MKFCQVYILCGEVGGIYGFFFQKSSHYVRRMNIRPRMSNICFIINIFHHKTSRLGVI